MGVCAMWFCVQRGIVVAFPDWTAPAMKWKKLVQSGFTGFVLAARRQTTSDYSDL